MAKSHKTTCDHRPWNDDGHCAEMTCPNYVEKCLDHRIARVTGKAAN